MEKLKLGVVGAGFMGSGIAETAAAGGLEVGIYEPQQDALDRSRTRIAESMAKAVARDKLTQSDADAVTSRLRFTTDLEDLADSRWVIEAIVEDADAKQAVFAELDQVVQPDAILASNTSSIPIASLGSATGRPQRVLGMHFFSPVPVMKLVEIVVSLETSDSTVAEAQTLAQHLGKTSIRTKDRSGFVVNLLLVPYLMAAVRMYEEGFADHQDIDEGMKLGCGYPMGPLALCDLIGLDVLVQVCDSLYDEFKRPEYAPPPLLRRMVAAGHLGRKSGRGFYEY